MHRITEVNTRIYVVVVPHSQKADPKSKSKSKSKNTSYDYKRNTSFDLVFFSIVFADRVQSLGDQAIGFFYAIKK